MRDEEIKDSEKGRKRRCKDGNQERQEEWTPEKEMTVRREGLLHESLVSLF